MFGKPSLRTLRSARSSLAREQSPFRLKLTPLAYVKRRAEATSHERSREFGSSRIHLGLNASNSTRALEISQVLGEELSGKGERVLDQAFRRACGHHIPA